MARSLLVAGDAGVVGLLVAGALGRSVPPAVEWRLQLAALAVPIAAPAAAAAAAVWALRAFRDRGPWAWAALTVHLAAVAAVVPRPPPGAEAAQGALRVITLNAGGDPAGERVGQFVRREAPDLVALQEAPASLDHGGARVLAGPAVQAVTSAGLQPAVATGTTTRVPTFTALPVVSNAEGTLGQEGDERAGVFSRTVVRWEGRDVAVYNVHLRSFNPERPSPPWKAEGVGPWFRALEGLGRDFVLRSQEADRLRGLFDEESLPFLVLGDLNSTPYQWAYARVARGLRDAARADRGWTATYPDRRPVVQIDAVLASPEWAVVSASVGPEGLSDHRALSAALALPVDSLRAPGAGADLHR